MARDTSQTEFHDLDRPSVGDSWSDAWDELVNTVDANLKRSGTISERPSTSNAPDDALFEATDQGLIYRNDPSNGWIVIGGTGSSTKSVPDQYVGAVHLDVKSSAPSSPSTGQVVIADGTNWDPDSDGNAEKVIYNGSSWIEDVDLGTSL